MTDIIEVCARSRPRSRRTRTAASRPPRSPRTTTRTTTSITPLGPAVVQRCTSRCSVRRRKSESRLMAPWRWRTPARAHRRLAPRPCSTAKDAAFMCWCSVKSTERCGKRFCFYVTIFCYSLLCYFCKNECKKMFCFLFYLITFIRSLSFEKFECRKRN